MGANSKIEWTDHTWNPWIGCSKVSPGCANCYAESEDARRKWTESGWGPGKARYRTSDANWRKPLAWNAQAKNAAERPRVFCASLADWLDPEVPREWLANLLDLIAETPHLDWLLLTKRPENIWGALLDAKFYVHPQTGGDLIRRWFDRVPPQNVWFGISTEDQERADERIPKLLSIPANVHWLSVEPLIGPLDLSFHLNRLFPPKPLGAGIDWVVVGGESGVKARPCKPEWVRFLRNQCLLHDIPFFFKQWGEYGITERRELEVPTACGIPMIGEVMERVGKKAAGRLLDDVLWSQFPEVRA